MNFWSGTKNLDQPAQNILGPVKGQGINAIHIIEYHFQVPNEIQIILNESL